MKWFVSSKISLESIIAAAMFALPTVAWSQTAEWTVYNTANSALPHNKIIGSGLAIDAQGNVWIGTGTITGGGGGLAKFDGENWTVYTTANSGLPCNNIYALAFDAQENLWIATGQPFGAGGGLAKFDGETWTVYTTENSGLSSKDVWAVALDAQGSLWIGTYGGGLARFDGETWTVYTTANSGLPYRHVSYQGLAFDGQGNVWIGTVEPTCGEEGGGLAKFDGQNWTVYNKTNSGLTSNDIWALSFDSQGNLWIGTGDDYTPEGGGLAKFDGENWTVYHTSNSPLTWHMVTSLAIDTKDNVWMGMCSGHTTTGGVAKFDGENWCVFNQWNSGLPHGTATGLAFDAQGNLWIGTYGGGLAVYRPLPAVDFNGDEIVDIDDLLILIEHWGTDEPLCDIGPTLGGDGIVDVEDLEVLMSYWQQEILPASLLAYWKLDETEGDIAHDSVFHNDGTLNGDPAWQPTGGMVAGALQFDGIDDYVSTPFFLNPADGPFSVFVWIKGGAPGQVIISQKDNPVYPVGVNWLGADSLQGNLMTELKGSGRGAAEIMSNFLITDGQWHRIGLVWDGSYRILYVDNVEVARDVQVQTGMTSAYGGLHIGAGNALEPGSFFSGLIDDVRIYDRAMTP